jgi:hypothetical protein
MKRLSFASLAYGNKKKQAKHEKFLYEIAGCPLGKAAGIGRVALPQSWYEVSNRYRFV